MDKVLITTTVSISFDENVPKKVIHLVMGDYGTRALRMVPVNGGQLCHMDESGVIRAKLRLASPGYEDLGIDCELGDTWATVTPTPGMTETAHTWSAQLVLYFADENTLSSAPFDIIVHDTVFEGDAVQHTDSRILDAYYKEGTGVLTFELLNGVTVTVRDTAFLTNYIKSVLNAEHALVTAEDRSALESIGDYLDQEVKTSSAPTFAGATIGGVTIDGAGNITGARFA